MPDATIDTADSQALTVSGLEWRADNPDAPAADQVWRTTVEGLGEYQMARRPVRNRPRLVRWHLSSDGRKGAVLEFGLPSSMKSAMLHIEVDRANRDETSRPTYDELQAEYTALNDRYMRLLTDQARNQRAWMQTAREEALAAASRSLAAAIGSQAMPHLDALMHRLGDGKGPDAVIDWIGIAQLRTEIDTARAAAVAKVRPLAVLCDEVRADARANRALAQGDGVAAAS